MAGSVLRRHICGRNLPLIKKLITVKRIIQELLGHNGIHTTERYTQVSNRTIQRVKSPLYTLNLKNTNKTETNANKSSFKEMLSVGV